MKELDKTKKYGLSKLTDEQLKELCKNIGYSIKLNNGCSLYYSSHFRHWIMTTMPFGDDLEKACATELFEDEESNVVTQYERMKIKENNKTMTEEEKELWLFVYKESVKYQQSFVSHKEKADQAVKDFRDALKM